MNRYTQVILLVTVMAGCRSPAAEPEPVTVATEPPSPVCEAEADGGVTLSMTAVSARVTEHGTMFELEATLHNDTCETLRVKSNFFSVFDGLSLAIDSTDGQSITSVHYTHHQSPATSDGNLFDLDPGSTTQKMVFPTDGIEIRGTVLVTLMGGLPGTDFETGLETESIEVYIED